MKSEIEKPGKYPIIYPKSSLASLNRGLHELNSWQTAIKAIANGMWWQLSLIAIGSASSVIYPHPPLVSFAAVAGNTLTRQKALTSVTSIWFANQLYGFTIRQYPRSLESLTWGLVMGVGMLTVTWLVTMQPKFSRNRFQGYLTWLGISVVGGYVIYQGSVGAIAQLMGGHGLTAVILGGIFIRDAVWAAVLSIAHCTVAWLVMQTIPKYFSPALQSGYRPPGCGRKS